MTISDAESFATARLLLRREGILGGSSAGTLVAAALRYCRSQSAPKRVVTFICDSGNKYLSKMYNDFWMIDQGFIQRETHGDLRDLITRRHSEGATLIVGPDDTLLTAYNRMRLSDVSQLPVLAEGKVVGIVDESDILLAVYSHHGQFSDPVRSAMSDKLETLSFDAPISALVPIFDQDKVAIVMSGTFLGLITRVDMLNYLRRNTKQ